MIAVSKLTIPEIQTAIKSNGAILDATAALSGNKDFEKTVRQGTNTPSFLKYRVNAVLDLLKNP